MSTFQRGDKNIANASGQVVREDMEDTLKATAANNFGPRSSAGTILPAEFIADNSTTPKKLLIRATSGGDQADPTSGSAATFYEVGNLDQDNLGLLLKSGGTMTGPLLGDDGSLHGSPAYSFDTDTDTGMFRRGANQIGFSCAGSEIGNFQTTGFSIQSTGSATRALFLHNKDNTAHIALKAPDTFSGNRSFTAPLDGTNGQVLQTNGSGVLSFQTFGSVPVGAVFCMAENVIPSGYVECNGQSLNKTLAANTELFNVIQYKYGGSGNNFNVPDLRGEFVRGWASNTTDSTRDQGRGIGTGQSGDITAHNHTYSNNSITVSGANHSHNIRKLNLNGVVGGVGVTLGSGQGYQVGYQNNKSGTVSGVVQNSGNLSMSGTVGISINNTGGSETRPRNVALMYVIKL